MKSFRSSRRRVVLNGGLAVVLVGGAVTAYFVVGSGNSASASSFTRNATVERGTVLAQVSASGNLALATQSSLAFGASGQVTAVKVSVGQQVTAGQVLATINPTAANLALTEANEQLTVAQDNLSKAQDGPSAQQQAVDNDQLTSDENAVNTAQDNLNAEEALPTTDCVGSTSTSNSGDSSSSKGSSSSSATSTEPQCQSAATITQDQNSLTSAEDSLQTAKDTQALNNAVDPGTIAQDQEAVTQAQASVNTAQQEVTGTTITAPSAGTILTIAGQVGTEVSAGTSTTGASTTSSGSSGSGSSGTSGTGSAAGGSSTTSGSSSTTSSGSSSSSGSTFVTMSDVNQLQITADVSETDIDSIKNGQDATISLNALPNTPLGATVSSISPTSTTVSNVVEYAVTLDLVGSAPSGVRPGQSASILITTGEATNALYVPSSAITTNGGSSYITVIANGKDTLTKVTTGVVGTVDTQIVSGATVGQAVLETINSASGTGGATTGRGFGGIGTGAGGAAGAGAFGGAGGLG